MKQRANMYVSQQEDYFREVDSSLEKASNGSLWLVDKRIATVVADAMHYRDGRDYSLTAYCIMPNHVHLVADISSADDTVERNDIPLYKVLQSLKRCTARKANSILHRSGAFWQSESYDRVIRNADELQRVIWYVLNNPVKAGLAESWRDWPWTYVKSGLA